MKACERMRTTPSALPKKILSDPDTTEVIFPGYGLSEKGEDYAGGGILL